jgi:hypothetical protein
MPARPARPLIAAALIALSQSASAQSTPPASAPAPAPTPTPGLTQVPLAQAPVASKLGARVTNLARAVPTIDTLVVVPSDSAYLAAVSSWTLKGRFPVLIDDGSPEAAEAIARFSRAFAPAKVVTWAGRPTDPAWPADPTERFKLMNLAVLRVWSLNPTDPPTEGGAERIITRLNNLGFTPPGIVVIDPNDHGWAAGLALAAARAQPMLRHDNPAGPRGVLPLDMADALQKSIETFLTSSRLPWDTLGDAIDSITLAFNIAPKCATPKPNDFVALTDRIGRKGPDFASRYAWTGQIFSSSTADAAYRAMCSLFLQPKDAWLFDGYQPGQPWDTFDCSAAANLLQSAGFKTSAIDHPNGTEVQWRTRAQTPVDAGLIFVNTMGNADFFQLFGGGQCKPGDVPVLSVPSAVHFVHSWSATEASLRNTVAGRWLERGAFCYMGSVQEPFLSAFVPTPLAAARLASGMPWGAAVRLDQGPVWKLTVIGDPLYTLSTAFGPSPTRDAEPAGEPLVLVAPLKEPLAGTPLADSMRAALKEQKLDIALRALVMLGRDQDASDLAAATLKSAPEKASSAFCAAAIPPLFRTGKPAAVIQAFAKLDAKDQARGDLRDILWFAAAPSMAGKPERSTLAVLKLALREDQLARDATDLGLAWARTAGKADALLTLEALAATAKEPQAKKDLEAATKAVRTGAR